MQIVAALFIEHMEMRQVEGPATRIDLTGVHFSMAAPSEPPLTLSPHLIVLVRCPPDDTGFHALNTEFKTLDGAELTRNKQPVQVEPGKFGYRLVRADLDFADYDTIEAHVRIDEGPSTVVPLTLLPPSG